MGVFRRIKDPVEGHGTIVDRPPAPAVTAATCTMKIDLDDVPGVERQVITYRESSMMTARWPEVGMRVAITDTPSGPVSVVIWCRAFSAEFGTAYLS